MTNNVGLVSDGVGLTRGRGVASELGACGAWRTYLRLEPDLGQLHHVLVGHLLEETRVLVQT